LSEGLDGAGVVEDEDEISEFEADLATEAAADGANGGGSGPSVSRYNQYVYANARGQLWRDWSYHVPSFNRATTTPDPNLPEPRNPALKTVRMARPLALARMLGGMILSGPKACRGSMKEARMRPHFLHSPVRYIISLCNARRVVATVFRGSLVVVTVVAG
jgi:hypothetical protein